MKGTIKNPRQLFLIDGIGALVSAFSLGIILTTFESTFGMPKNVLYLLAFPACLFALYSISCYIRTPKNWQPYLKAIAIANLLYCCATAVLVLYFHPQLATLGLIYFVLELVIILILVSVEYKAASDVDFSR